MTRGTLELGSRRDGQVAADGFEGPRQSCQRSPDRGVRLSRLAHLSPSAVAAARERLFRSVQACGGWRGYPVLRPKRSPAAGVTVRCAPPVRLRGKRQAACSARHCPRQKKKDEPGAEPRLDCRRVVAPGIRPCDFHLVPRPGPAARFRLREPAVADGTPVVAPGSGALSLPASTVCRAAVPPRAGCEPPGTTARTPEKRARAFRLPVDELDTAKQPY